MIEISFNHEEDVFYNCILVNGRELKDYFTNQKLFEEMVKPRMRCASIMTSKFVFLNAIESLHEKIEKTGKASEVFEWVFNLFHRNAEFFFLFLIAYHIVFVLFYLKSEYNIKIFIN